MEKRIHFHFPFSTMPLPSCKKRAVDDEKKGSRPLKTQKLKLQKITEPSVGSMEVPGHGDVKDPDPFYEDRNLTKISSQSKGAQNTTSESADEEYDHSKYVTDSGFRYNRQNTYEDLLRLLPPGHFLEESQHGPDCRCFCCKMEWVFSDSD